MPPAFIQSKGGTSNTLSSLPVSFTSNNAAGNLLVCSGVVNASGIAGLTITDTQGNTWTIALVDNWKPLNTFFMAYAPNCKAGANTVTIAQLGSLISGAVSEYSGVSTTTPLDEVGFSDSGSGTWTAATSGNVITRENGELIVAAQGNSTGPASVTLGSGFTNLQNDSGNFVSIESQVQTTAGAIAGTFTISASSGACGILTFVPPADALPFNVWTPQGNVVAGAVNGQPCVIYEGNAQILSGTVFKMWYSVSSGGINYAESLDGKTWTQFGSNPVIAAGQVQATVVHNGATYYAFCSTGFSNNGGINIYTSSNGTTWSLAVSNAIPTAASGWDSGGIFIGDVLIVGGTWYAFYNGIGAHYQTGVATATNPLGPWTKFSGNPVVTVTGTNLRTVVQVNGTYYSWTQIRYPGLPLIGNAAQSASCISRFSAPTPLGPWTQLQFNGTPVSTYYAATAADFYSGSTELNNQPGDPWTLHQNDGTPVQVGGISYLWYSLGFGNTAAFQINLATTTQTMAQIVTSYEGVVGVPIPTALSLNLTTQGSDPGTGANANPIGGNWTTNSFAFFPFQRASNLIEPSTITAGQRSAVGYWNNPIISAADQWGQLTAAANAVGTTMSIMLRQSTGANTNCRFQWGVAALGSQGTWILDQLVAGSGTILLQGSAVTVSSGDILTCVVNGASIYGYWNKILVGAATVSGSVAAGNAGLYLQADAIATSDVAISAWSGGTFQDAPALQASISGNAGAGGATVAYSGTSSGSVMADSFGNYLLSNLPDGSYTITPSLLGYTFSPTSSNQILSGTNITGVNFVATQQSSTTAGPSSGLQSVQLYGRLANGSIVAVSVDINGNLAVSGGTGGTINSVDVLKNGVATPAMVYGVTSAGKLVAVAVDANGNLCCANVGTGGGNSSTTVDIAKYATPTPVQAVGREPISGKLYAVPLNDSNSLYDSVHPGATPTSSLTVPGVAPRPVQLCGRAPNGKIIAVALDTSGRLCVSGSGQSGSANAVDAFKNGVPLAIQLFGINSAGKLQPVPLDANGNLELS